MWLANLVVTQSTTGRSPLQLKLSTRQSRFQTDLRQSLQGCPRFGPQVVEMFKPVDRPDWMKEEDYAKLPETLMVRELQYEVGRPGSRTRWVTLVTTLLDAEIDSAEALAELYASRWRVETNLKHLKTTMNMDVLKCKNVDGVMKELMVYAIVYNLVRL